MKIFAICIGLTFGIFAIAVYAYSIKQRIKDSKAGGCLTFTKFNIQKISYIFHIFGELNRFSINLNFKGRKPNYNI